MAVPSQGHHRATAAPHGQGTAWVRPGFKPATGLITVSLLTMHFQVIYCSGPLMLCSAKKLQTSLIHIKDAGEIGRESSTL